MTMVYQNNGTKRWFFRVTVRSSDGSRQRMHGTPGIPGPYHDLPQCRLGALEAERRAIRRATNALTIDATLRKAVDAFAAAELRRGLRPSAISNVYCVLSRLVSFATGEKTTLRPLLREARTDARAVDPADIERLLVACEDDGFRAAILLASDTGLRASEIVDLQWSDLKDAELAVRVPMHDKVRSVPMTSRVTETLAAMPRLGRWVVSSLDGSKIDAFALMRAIGAIFDRASVVRPTGGLIRCLGLTFRISELAKRGR